jgi:DNA-binding NtrC family response regulator
MDKLLVVEDNKALQEMLASILSEKGYAVKTADDASDALMLLKKESFHVIISDLQMPGLDGIGFLEKVKHLNIPFILLTAYGSIELAVEKKKKWAFDFVSKPVDPDYLFLLVEKALDSTRILRENIIFKEILAEQQEKSVIVPIKSSPSDISSAAELERQHMGVGAERSFADLDIGRDFVNDVL